MNILVLDTETTGLSPEKDEILQVSMMDGKHNVLIDEYTKPTHNDSWEDAMRINHITPEMVSDKQHFEFHKDFIQKQINNADIIVGYNQAFDLKFFEASGIVVPSSKKQFDVMRKFAPIYGERRDDGKIRFKKLVFAAEYFGYKFNAHDSMEDVRATYFVYNKINTPIKRFVCKLLNPIRKARMKKFENGNHGEK